VVAGDGIRCDFPVALIERAATTGLLAASQLLAEWNLRATTIPMQGRHRIVASARRMLARDAAS
jgi:isorenieratene synthase